MSRAPQDRALTKDGFENPRSRGPVYFLLRLRPFFRGDDDLADRACLVGFIHRTEPRRRAQALLLLLITPRTTGTLLVHLLPLYLSFSLFSHVRPLPVQSILGVLMYIRVSPPAGTDRIRNKHGSTKGKVCQAPCENNSGRTQSRLADHIHVIARSLGRPVAATKNAC